MELVRIKPVSNPDLKPPERWIAGCCIVTVENTSGCSRCVLCVTIVLCVQLTEIDRHGDRRLELKTLWWWWMMSFRVLLLAMRAIASRIAYGNRDASDRIAYGNREASVHVTGSSISLPQRGTIEFESPRFSRFADRQSFAKRWKNEGKKYNRSNSS